jgi:hypothetical protein
MQDHHQDPDEQDPDDHERKHPAWCVLISSGAAVIVGPRVMRKLA